MGQLCSLGKQLLLFILRKRPTLCGENAEFVNVKTRGKPTYISHCSLKNYPWDTITISPPWNHVFKYACNRVRCVLKHITTTVVVLALNNVRLCMVEGRDQWISIWPRYTKVLDIPRLWSCPPVPLHMFYEIQIYFLCKFVRRSHQFYTPNK